MGKFLLFTMCMFVCNHVFGQEWNHHSIDSLNSVLRNDTSKINKLDSISFQLSKEDPILGEYTGKLALKRAQTLRWRKGIANSMNCIANNYMTQAKYSEAIDYLRSSKEINLEIGNTKGVIQNNINLGICFYHFSDYISSLNYYFDALNIALESNDTPNLSKCYNGLAGTYLQLNKVDSAIFYYERALYIYQYKNDSLGIVKVQHNLGNAYYKKGNLERAREHYQEAYNRADTTQIRGKDEEIILNLTSIADTYAGKKDFDTALYIYNIALSYAENHEIYDSSYVAVILANIADAYISILLDSSFSNLKILGKYHRDELLIMAKGNLLASINVFSKSNSFLELVQSLNDLSQVQELMGEFRDALTSFRRSVSLKDSILGEETQIQVEQTIREQQVFEQQSRLDRLEKKNSTKDLFLVLIGLVLILLFFVLLSLRKQIDFVTRDRILILWSFILLFVSGFASLQLEPKFPIWTHHQRYLMLLCFMLIPVTAELINYFVRKELKNKRFKFNRKVKR